MANENWNLSAREIKGLRLSDYPGKTPREARVEIAKLLVNKIPCVSGEQISQNSLSAYVTQDQFTETEIYSAVDGITWVNANVDGTANTYQIKKNEPVCLDTTTGNCITGVNPSWNIDEYTPVGIAQDDYQGPGRERVPVKLTSSRQKSATQETQIVWVSYAPPLYADRIVSEYPIGSTTANYIDGLQAMYRGYIRLAYPVIFKPDPVNSDRIVLSKDTRPTAKKLRVVNFSQWPFSGFVRVTKIAEELYAIMDDRTPAAYFEWTATTDSSYVGPNPITTRHNQTKLVRGNINRGQGQNNVTTPVFEGIEFCHYDNATDIYLRYPGSYQITFGGEFTAEGMLVKRGWTESILSSFQTGNPQIGATSFLTSTDSDQANPLTVRHGHQILLPAFVTCRVGLFTSILDPLSGSASLSEGMADASFDINIWGEFGWPLPGASLYAQLLHVGRYSGERQFQYTYTGEGTGTGQADRRWRRLAIGYTCIHRGGYYDPSNLVGSNEQTADGSYVKVRPIKAWIRIQGVGYDKRYDVFDGNQGDGEVHWDAVGGPSPPSFQWWGNSDRPYRIDADGKSLGIQS